MYVREIYVKKIKSIKLTDIASAIDPEIKQDIIGCRPGEKLHEQMISTDDAPYTYEYNDYFKVLPAINNWSKDKRRINDGKLVNPNFSYFFQEKSLDMYSPICIDPTAPPWTLA